MLVAKGGGGGTAPRSDHDEPEVGLVLVEDLLVLLRLHQLDRLVGGEGLGEVDQPPCQAAGRRVQEGEGGE